MRKCALEQALMHNGRKKLEGIALRGEDDKNTLKLIRASFEHQRMMGKLDLNVNLQINQNQRLDVYAMKLFQSSRILNSNS